MNILELMLAVDASGYAAHVTDPEFHDVIQLLDNGASVYFEDHCVTMEKITPDDAPRPVRVDVPRLSPRGQLFIGELFKKVLGPEAIYVLDTDFLLADLTRQAEEQWADAVVPIFSESPKRFVSAAGFGSGVVCSVGDTSYFVTCYHVVEDFEKFQIVQANLAGRAFPVAELDYKRDSAADVAIAPLSAQDLLAVGLERTKLVPLNRDWSGWTGTGIFVAMGYPGTQNELKLGFNSTTRYCFLMFARATSHRSKATKLERYLALEYNRKNIRRPDGSHYNPPDLDGMSGGPCFEIMKRWAFDRMAYSFRLAGLVCEFRPEEPLLLIADVSAALDCLNRQL